MISGVHISSAYRLLHPKTYRFKGHNLLFCRVLQAGFRNIIKGLRVCGPRERPGKTPPKTTPTAIEMLRRLGGSSAGGAAFGNSDSSE